MPNKSGNCFRSHCLTDTLTVNTCERSYINEISKIVNICQAMPWMFVVRCNKIMKYCYLITCCCFFICRQFEVYVRCMTFFFSLWTCIFASWQGMCYSNLFYTAWIRVCMFFLRFYCCCRHEIRVGAIYDLKVGITKNHARARSYQCIFGSGDLL